MEPAYARHPTSLHVFDHMDDGSPAFHHGIRACWGLFVKTSPRHRHDASPEYLIEAYRHRAEHEIPIGLRWFYCAGLGIVISLSHVHKEFDGQRINKNFRIPTRVAVAVIFLCLPLAESLSSLELVSITTGLTVLVLMVDVYGSMSIHDNFWKCTSQCKYRANCPLKKKRLVDAVNSGIIIKLEGCS